MTTIDEMASMISQERRDVYHAMNCARLWKRAAKKWRRLAKDCAEVFVEENEARVDAEATATRRKELLRRVYADATNQGHCPFCRMECTAYSFGSWGEREYKHAADCELARELGDDTVG